MPQVHGRGRVEAHPTGEFPGEDPATLKGPEVVADAVTQVAGPIRMTAPVSFGTLHLSAALAEFIREHPKVELDVTFDDGAGEA